MFERMRDESNGKREMYVSVTTFPLVLLKFIHEGYGLKMLY